MQYHRNLIKVGMGLNLNISRIIFTTIKKTTKRGNGKMELVTLTESEVKQIAGRAGRSDQVGYVTAMKPDDLNYIRDIINNSTATRSMKRKIEEIKIRMML